MFELLENGAEGPTLRSGMSRLNPTSAAVTLALLACALTACAPWVQVEGPFRVESHGYEVGLPAGWWRATTVGDSLLLTRDGVSLQYIRIERVVVGEELPRKKKKFAKRMSRQDVAEVELDEARSDQGTMNLELLENVPFQVAGLPGFKLMYTFKTESGLRLKRIHYVVLVRNWVYWV